MDHITSPPPPYVTTREGLRALACYVISPARKQRTGRIGLRPAEGGFATPPFDDGTRIMVRGDRLAIEPGADAAITTLRAAADFLGIDLSADPGVGHDLPPFTPDADLNVDAAASWWLGAWYAFGADQLERLTTRLDNASVTEAQLWPEHFDLAVAVATNGQAANVGFSPGDSEHPDPYVYVGPHDTAGLDGDYWNAPFGAVLGHDELHAAPDPGQSATAFIDAGLRLLDQTPG